MMGPLARILFGLGITFAAGAAPVDAGPVGSEREVTAQGEVLDMFPQPSGGYLVVWEHAASGGLAAREYDAAGAPLAAEFPFAASPFDADDVARDGAGRFVVVESASDGYSYGVFAERWDATGAPIGAAVQANVTTGGAQWDAAVAADAAGGFLVFWEDVPLPTDVFGRAFDNAAAPVSAEFSPHALGNFAAVPTVEADGLGNFIVAWGGAGPGDNLGLFARRYDGAGAALGPVFLVNSYTTGGNGGSPAITATGAGSFIVVWTGAGPGDDSGVFARRFDASATPLGPEFLVNSYTTGFQDNGRASYGGSGQYVIVWSESDGASNHEVFGRRFDGSGAALGPQFQVNTQTAISSLFPGVVPRVLVHPSGEFTVTWPGRGDNDFFVGTRAQRFDAAGQPVPGDVPIAARRLSIKDPPLATRRSLTVSAVDDAAVNGINPLVRPDVQGAFLHVYNPATGDSACMPLPAAGWLAHVGTLDDPFVYKDTQQVHGPCRSAKLTRGARLSARCGGAGIAFTLDEPSQGGVAVSLNLGAARYCTVFDGASIRKDSGPDGRFVARNAAAPVSCPAPPVSCP